MNFNRQWDEILEPCREAGCSAEVVLWQNAMLFSTFVQHGPNPEHRKTFDDVDIVKSGGWSLVPHIRSWLARVHAPPVWETA